MALIKSNADFSRSRCFQESQGTFIKFWKISSEATGLTPFILDLQGVSW